MAEYSEKAQNAVEKTMREFRLGKLRNGKTGKIVTSAKQAIAIAIAKSKKQQMKVPGRYG